MRDSSYFHEIDIQRNALTQCTSDTLRLHQSTVQAHCQICLEILHAYFHLLGVLNSI